MYYNMPCWKCGKPLRASDEMVGRKARCPYCGAVGEILPPPSRGVPGPQAAGEALAPTTGPGAAPTTAPAATQGAQGAFPPAAAATSGEAAQAPASASPPAAAEHGRGGHSRGTSASVPLTALLGLIGAGVFYGALVFPLPDIYVRRLFAGRGWVPYVITFLTFWAMAMLAMKYRKLRVQRSALLFDALPSEVAHEIRPDNVEAFRSNLLSLPIRPEHSFLIGRVLRALEHYRVHPNTEGVATVLRTQSDIEANTVETSYTMVRVLIWAIPILGFIGTVVGVGQAVGSFSGVIGAAKDFAAVKDSLGDVTSGLGVAFDTTLLALVMSLLVMFPASGLQKAEEDLLASVDQYCNENVLRRLCGHHTGPGAQTPGAPAAEVAEALGRHSREMAAWMDKMGEMSRRITHDVADAWTRVRESFEQAHRQQVDASTDDGRAVVEAAGKVHTQLAETTGKVAELARLHEGLADVSRRMLDRAESVAGDGELRRTLAKVDEHLERTGRLLDALCDRLDAPPPEAQGVVDLQPAALEKRRRRWWLLGLR